MTKDNNGEEGEGGNDHNRDDDMYVGNNMDQVNKISSGDEDEDGGSNNSVAGEMLVAMGMGLGVMMSLERATMREGE